MPPFCRDCLTDTSESALRCPACGSPQLLRHPALDRLGIAHVDCDAFYATVEKRDDPSLAAKPVIIGGGRRGVVSAACYVARTYGVRSAMPMFQARRLCPQAVVIRPDMAKYVRVGREVRRLMLEMTPLVEPLSIDEAFLDMRGTELLHDAAPAKQLARFAKRVEDTIGITVSIGLSVNKFLAKIASDLDKPRGFAVLGGEEARVFIAPKPVTLIWGVGRATAERLARDGFHTVGDLAAAGEETLLRAYGREGSRLSRLARGLDDRPVTPDREAKSVSSETTFDDDVASFRKLERTLWILCEKVSARLKTNDIAGATITLKLKSADFKTRTRARSIEAPTQLAATLFTCGRELLVREASGASFRLIGIGVSDLAEGRHADPGDLLDRRAAATAATERAIDRLRDKFGANAIVRGIAFRGEDD